MFSMSSTTRYAPMHRLWKFTVQESGYTLSGFNVTQLIFKLSHANNYRIFCAPCIMIVFGI